MNESVQLKASSEAKVEVVGEDDEEAVPSSSRLRMLPGTINRPEAAIAAAGVDELAERRPP